MKIYKGLISRITLDACFYEARLAEANFVGLKIMYRDKSESVLKIVRAEKFEEERAYYQKSYNEDLTSKLSPDRIQIVGLAYGNTVQEIAKVLS